MFLLLVLLGIIQDLAVHAASSTLTICPDNSNPVTGQPVSYTAIVAALPPDTGVPTGSVTFTPGGTVNLVDGAASVSVSWVTGLQTITAVYGGDGTFNGVTYSITGPVGKASTTLSLSAPASSVTGQTVTFTATVSASSPSTGVPTPTGSISFGSLGSATLVNGVATLQTSFNAVSGNQVLSAAYGGDANYNGANSDSVTVVVGKASTAVALCADVQNPVTGQPVTYTATVSSVSPGSGTPTGSVTFNNANTVALVDGVATVTLSWNAGLQVLNAVYNGDNNYNGNSYQISGPVSKASTSLTLTANPSSSVTGQSVTFTATVAVVSPGTGIISGESVSFGSLGTATLVNGVATITTSFNAINGDQTVSATYGGNSNYLGSSGNVVVPVAPAPTSVSILSNPSGTVVGGELVTYTVSVSSAYGIPTGTVTLTPGGTQPLQTVSGQGQVSITIQYTTAGTNTFTAVYNGDGNFAVSQNHEDKQVNAASTTTSFTLNPNPPEIVVGQTITLTATVTPQSPSAGPATGSVVVSPGNTVLPLVNGFVSSSIAFFAIGTNVPVTVTYQPDVTGYLTSQAILQKNLTRAGTDTKIAYTPTNPTVGQTVQVTATVTVKAPGGGSPDGSIDFNGLGVVPVSNGQASVSFTITAKTKVKADYTSSSGLYKISSDSVQINPV